MFTIMTWNVENLFEPAPADRADFDAKLTALADVITAARPDLLGVQEIGDQRSFQELCTRLGPAWNGVLSTRFDASHAIRVGWLSPRPLSDVTEVVDLPAALSPVTVADGGATMTRMGRGALVVTCRAASGVRVRALTAHLKSKLLSFRGGRFSTRDEGERVRYGFYALHRRAAEAAAVREWATATLAGTWAGPSVVACGDLNDTLDAATTQLLLGPPGSQYRTGGFGRPDLGDPQRLWAVGHEMSPPDDWSRINQGRRELIDHVLVSHALSGRLLETGTIPLDVPSMGAEPRSTPRAAGEPPSDHRPVLARFDL